MAAEPSPRPSNDDRIKAALWFAERGFGIFPVWSARANGTCRCPLGADCTSPGKHPLTPNGFQDSTTEAERIRTFLAAASHPNYGMVPPEGVFVWDVDTDTERENLSRLSALHGPLPETLHSQTANGEHVFLRWPDTHPRPIKRMFGLVTRWGSGRQAGYVVGPRSVHASGAEYKPAEGTSWDIAELPDTWAQAAVGGEGGVRVRGRTAASEVAVGHRHDHLRDTARLYAGVVRDADALFAAVWAENEKLSEPKTEDEVRRAIGDVLERFPPDPREVIEARAERLEAGDLDILPPTALGQFPEILSAVALGGLVGECVEDMARGTDASLAGLLASFLAICGAMVPVRVYSRGDQTSSPFMALVGESSIGRKGTAMHRALGAARFTWQSDHVNAVLLDGLNSGEALIAALHERRTNTFNVGKPTVALVFEDEFSSMLQSRGREGSTLDQKMRLAFDGSSLSNRRRAEAQVVTPPYWLPALAAITPVELRSMLDAGATRNGSANRWLYVPVVKRDVIAPDEPPILDGALQEALITARDRGKERVLEVEPAVSRVLSEYAEHVMKRAAGVSADLVRRYQTHAIRVALVHAAVERSTTITPDHLERALALTEYARSGIAWVFGQTIGNRDADLLLRHLQEHGALRQNAITRQVIRDPIRRQEAIDELVRLRYARVDRIVTHGRQATELRMEDGLTSTFVPFRPIFRPRSATLKTDLSSKHPLPHTSDDDEKRGRLDESPVSRSDGLDESWTKDGRKMDETVVDASTGEVEDQATATFVIPCRDYQGHRGEAHRRGADGLWHCLTCEEETP